MTEAEYDERAAQNPHAPSFSDARKNAAKIAIGQAVQVIDANGDPKQAAAFLAAAISLLVDE